MFTCPECDTPINVASGVCPHCGADLAAPREGLEAGFDRAGIAPPRNARKTIIGIGVLLAFMGLVMWYSLSIRPGGQRTERETHARESLIEMQQALTSYETAEGHFPSSLEDLGAVAKPAIELAQSAGYELQYQPASPGADGRVSDYGLTARPANYGYLSMFMDASGSIHGTHEQRAATVNDPPI